MLAGLAWRAAPLFTRPSMTRSLLTLACVLITGTLPAADSQLVYFGSYTNGDSKSRGIYVSTFNQLTGVLSPPELAAETPSPSFLTLHPSGKFLYAVAEAEVPQISAFQVGLPGGRLQLLNQLPSGGRGPCFVETDKTGKMAFAAHYTSGQISSFSLQKDGHLAGPQTVLQHKGSSVDAARQKGPHAHSFRPSPDNRFALACDLGTDRVYVYAIDPAHGTFAPHGEAALPPGSGPRHLAFHPNGKWVFVNNEMLMTASTFAYDAAQGALLLKETVSTLPEADREKKGFSTAEIVVHPNGKFVYVSNRTHDTLAIFACDADTGKLTLLENVPAEGQVPRNFALDPTGNWMLVAHQASDSVAVFKVDPQTGRLQFTGQKIEVGKPCCVRFLAVRQ